MKKIIIIILLFISIPCFAWDFESAISGYEPVYFLFGDMQDQVLFQISAKYNLIYPSKIGAYAAYTQQSWWHLYDSSSPFNETNYQPELFWLIDRENKDIFFNNFKYIDYIRISPICHKSNGEDKDRNRSINSSYVKVQLSNRGYYIFGLSGKLFCLYGLASENSDIRDYKGFFEGEFFIKNRSKTVKYFDKEKVYFKYGGNFITKKGWFESGLRLRLITSKIQPYLLLQFWHGYGESLINYNKKETNFRVGITFQ